jgi:hypothetical protein
MPPTVSSVDGNRFSFQNIVYVKTLENGQSPVTQSHMWNFVWRKVIYIVQSIILWIGRIVALLCTTADMWSHKMVPCSFFSCPSKKQLCACSVFRKKVTVVTGSCLWAAEIENVAVWAIGNVEFCQKLDKFASETFQMIKQAYSKEALGHSAVFKWHKHFA